MIAPQFITDLWSEGFSRNRRRADHHPQVVIFAMSGKNILQGPVLMMT
jgi:hypothetical protein